MATKKTTAKPKPMSGGGTPRDPKPPQKLATGGSVSGPSTKW